MSRAMYPVTTPFNQTSSSQIDTFELCNTKWWLQKRMKLRWEDKDYFFYGTGLHSVNERYLHADDAGRDPKTGKPVDLFPPGWDEMREWEKNPETGNNRHVVKYRYTDEERERIEAQVMKAIETGVLERRPNREIEKRIEMPVVDGVRLLGYIDLLHPGEVVDHKTAKNRRYATTKGKLEKGNRQLLIYAKHALELSREAPGADLDEVRVRHNLFLKDGSDPYFVETTYSAVRIDEEWEKVKAITKEMIRTSKIQSINDVDDPPQANACLAFGGCEFRKICGRRETFHAYKVRVEHLNRTRVQRLAAQQSGDPEMGAFDNMLANDPRTSEPATDMNAPEETSATAGAVERAAAGESRRMAPWADPECAACDENRVGGFKESGTVCRICLLSLDERKVPEDQQPANFEVTPFEWKKKPSNEPAEEVAAAEPEPAATEEAAESLPTETTPRKTAKEKAKEKSRARKGFTLCIGCAPVQMTNPNGKFVSGDQVFEQWRKRFCEEKQVESYWHYDAFARRDAMALAAEHASEEFGTKMVVFTSVHSPDVRSFVEALKGLAGTTIVGTVG